MKRIFRILLVMALVGGVMFTRLKSASAGSNEVWVDDDWAGSSPGEAVGGHVFGTDAFATVQDGVNAVESPGTVNVAAGTYQETVSLKGGVQVLGTGADLTTIGGTGSGVEPRRLSRSGRFAGRSAGDRTTHPSGCPSVGKSPGTVGLSALGQLVAG